MASMIHQHRSVSDHGFSLTNSPVGSHIMNLIAVSIRLYVLVAFREKGRIYRHINGAPINWFLHHESAPVENIRALIRNRPLSDWPSKEEHYNWPIDEAEGRRRSMTRRDKPEKDGEKVTITPTSRTTPR